MIDRAENDWSCPEQETPAIDRGQRIPSGTTACEDAVSPHEAGSTNTRVSISIKRARRDLRSPLAGQAVGGAPAGNRTRAIRISSPPALLVGAAAQGLHPSTTPRWIGGRRGFAAWSNGFISLAGLRPAGLAHLAHIRAEILRGA
jgi:hypothetical protein